MAALDARERFQLSCWDSAIIEACRAMGCTEVLSQDMGDGRDYAGGSGHQAVPLTGALRRPAGRRERRIPG
jgi:hypothetical protein